MPTDTLEKSDSTSTPPSTDSTNTQTSDILPQTTTSTDATAIIKPAILPPSHPVAETKIDSVDESQKVVDEPKSTQTDTTTPPESSTNKDTKKDNNNAIEPPSNLPPLVPYPEHYIEDTTNSSMEFGPCIPPVRNNLVTSSTKLEIPTHNTNTQANTEASNAKQNEKTPDTTVANKPPTTSYKDTFMGHCTSHTLPSNQQSPVDFRDDICYLNLTTITQDVARPCTIEPPPPSLTPPSTPEVPSALPTPEESPSATPQPTPSTDTPSSTPAPPQSNEPHKESGSGHSASSPISPAPPQSDESHDDMRSEDSPAAPKRPRKRVRSPANEPEPTYSTYSNLGIAPGSTPQNVS